MQGQLPDNLILKIEDGIAVLALNRPNKRNALSDDLALALEHFFSNIPSDVKAVVLHGKGDHFCSGLDLNEIKETSTIENFKISMNGQKLNDSIQYCSVPVVCVLHGAVIGGGLELAAASHIRVAEKTAFYSLPEGKHGIFLGSGGSVRLPRLIGSATVMDMMLTGRVYNATDAHTSLRLSQYLVEANEGLEFAIQLAKKISKNSATANFAIIQALPRIIEQDPKSGLFTEMLMAGVTINDDEAKTRLSDFFKLNTAS